MTDEPTPKLYRVYVKPNYSDDIVASVYRWADDGWAAERDIPDRWKDYHTDSYYISHREVTTRTQEEQ